MGKVTVFSGPERRRRRSEEDRLRILSEACAPGACVAEVCRRHDISSALIYTWRRKLLDADVARDGDVPEALPAPVFAEAVIDGTRWQPLQASGRVPRAPLNFWRIRNFSGEVD